MTVQEAAFFYGDYSELVQEFDALVEQGEVGEEILSCNPEAESV